MPKSIKDGVTTMTFSYIAVFAVASLLFFTVRPKNLPLLCLVVGDEDIKIAGEQSAALSPPDAADLAAREFLRQKQNGNIDRAHNLGGSFAELLWDLAQSIIMDNDLGLTQQEIHHQLLLCSYAVNRVISQFSPNSIVAQTALGRFYAEVENRSNVLYRHVSDTAAFSLYMLNERSGGGDCEIGKIFAKLIGHENDPEGIRQGSQVYTAFYDSCKSIIDQVQFSD